MSIENRLSLVDGTVEKVCFKQVDLSKLPKLDPFIGAVTKKIRRLSLVDGSLEETEIIVLPPFSKKGETV